MWIHAYTVVHLHKHIRIYISYIYTGSVRFLILSVICTLKRFIKDTYSHYLLTMWFWTGYKYTNVARSQIIPTLAVCFTASGSQKHLVVRHRPEGEWAKSTERAHRKYFVCCYWLALFFNHSESELHAIFLFHSLFSPFPCLFHRQCSKYTHTHTVRKRRMLKCVYIHMCIIKYTQKEHTKKRIFTHQHSKPNADRVTFTFFQQKHNMFANYFCHSYIYIMIYVCINIYMKQKRNN